MRLRVLGSNATYPTPGHPASGYLVDHDGTLVLLDAGPATFPALMDHIDPAGLDAIVLSHVHADHSADVFALFAALRYGSAGVSALPLLAPDGVAERIACFAGADPGHDLFRIFDFRTVAPGDRVRIGSVLLSFAAAVHPVPAVVTSVTGGDRRLVYSGDTGPGSDLVQAAAGAQVLLCEATTQGTPGPDAYPYHLSAGQAGQIAREAGVERLIVTHLAPGSEPTVSVSEAAEAFGGPVGWAAPGMEEQI